MGKLAVLRLLTGDLRQDIQAVLSIESTGITPGLPRTEVSGVLPANPNLAHTLQQWQSNYRCLEGTRIQPQGIYLNRRQAAIDACHHLEPEVRSQFNDWLLTDSFRAIRDKWLAELMKEEVLILVRASEPSLLRLPWYVWDLVEQNPSAEIALNVCNTEPISPIDVPTTRNKVKILAILGNREGIDIERDRQLLSQLTDAEVTFLVEPQRMEINDQMWEQQWDILFFAGHSRTEDDRGRIYINQTDSLTIAELRHALQKAISKGLQLAIFNSCDGLGLALDLQQLQLPQVIVMREPVTDRVAQAFLRYFLPAFASGQPLHLAVREARLRLQGLENELPGASWLPVIVQSTITSSLTWQQLGHAHTSLPPKQQWWQIPMALCAASLIGLGAWQLFLNFRSPDSFTARTSPNSSNADFNVLQPTSCNEEKTQRSTPNGKSTHIRIVNKSKFPIKAYWIDYGGERRKYLDLAAGKSHNQQTFTGHPWLITSDQENQPCLGIFWPTIKKGLVTLY
jgi:CHAT domain/VHL beta domain